MPLYLGLISGTSMDGIDAVLLAVEPDRLTIRAAHHRDWPGELRLQLRDVAEHPESSGLVQLGALDVAVGIQFAAAAAALLDRSGVDPGAVRAIGSHGQTVCHAPHGDLPFTLQIGDPNVLAERLGIDVVADFRRRDLAAGGQGAPLTPAFHAAAFASSEESRAVVNIGGIANVTLLARDGSVRGCDAGPGNCLLDAWSRRCVDQPFDQQGAWAATGTVHGPLLERLLAEPYFARPEPKSTGRELFSDAWLDRQLGGFRLPAKDVQATLAELTVRTIAAAVRPAVGDPRWRVERVLICGGGAFNPGLMGGLAAALPGVCVESTAALGMAPEHVEGAAFAWLAHRHVCALPGNVPAVTGARHAVKLGALYPGR